MIETLRTGKDKLMRQAESRKAAKGLEDPSSDIFKNYQDFQENSGTHNKVLKLVVQSKVALDFGQRFYQTQESTDLVSNHLTLIKTSESTIYKAKIRVPVIGSCVECVQAHASLQVKMREKLNTLEESVQASVIEVHEELYSTLKIKQRKLIEEELPAALDRYKPLFDNIHLTDSPNGLTPFQHFCNAVKANVRKIAQEMNTRDEIFDTLKKDGEKAALDGAAQARARISHLANEKRCNHDIASTNNVLLQDDKKADTAMLFSLEDKILKVSSKTGKKILKSMIIVSNNNYGAALSQEERDLVRNWNENVGDRTEYSSLEELKPMIDALNASTTLRKVLPWRVTLCKGGARNSKNDDDVTDTDEVIFLERDNKQGTNEAPDRIIKKRKREERPDCYSHDKQNEGPAPIRNAINNKSFSSSRFDDNQSSSPHRGGYSRYNRGGYSSHRGGRPNARGRGSWAPRKP